MPQFRYRATNSQGHDLEGTMSAADANAAVVQLSRQGLRLKSIEEGMSVVQPPTYQAQAAAPPIARPQVRMNTVSVRAPVAPTLTKVANTVKTTSSKNDELFFLFAQLSNLIRSGITTAEALTQMSQRTHNSKFRQPLQEMARMAGEGGSLAAAMEHYPDLFSPGHVGAVRAGENGGYLPEALQVMSDQCKETHKLMRAYWWLGLALIATVTTFAVALSGSVGIDRLIMSINDPNDPKNSLGAGMRDAMLGPVGLGVVLFFVFYFITKAWLRRTDSRFRRHSMALGVPLVGKRAKSENLALFSWHLNKLGKAGISPYTSWNLAADAVPNAAFSEKLRNAGAGMGENTKLSSMLYKSNLFPHEISAIVETGEVTGDLGPSLDQAMDYARADQQVADTTLKIKAGCWATLLIFGGGMIAFMIMYSSYLHSAFKVLDD